MKPQTIIWLNGASSSGKSSVSKAIINLLPQKTLRFDTDEYAHTPDNRNGLEAIFLNQTQLGL